MNLITSNLLIGLLIIAGVFAWSIRIYSRVNRHVAPMLEEPHTSWNAWHAAVQLDGIWNGLPIRIKSIYTKPPRLSVTVRVVTHPPELEARVNRSGKIEFRAIRHDRIGKRLLAHVIEDELSRSGPPVRAAITEYFTPARIEALRVLFFALEWKRFVRNQEGIGVSGHGVASVRWKPHEARDQLLRTLYALQRMGVGS
jgi:hypothetical protein